MRLLFQSTLPKLCLAGTLMGLIGCDEPRQSPPRTAANQRKSASFDPERLFSVIHVRRDDPRGCKSTGDRFLPSLNPDDKNHITGFLFYHCRPASIGTQAKEWRLQLFVTCYSSEHITETDLKQMGGFACRHGNWGASWEAETCQGEESCRRTDPVKNGKKIGEGIRWSSAQARDFFTHDYLPAMVW